MTAVISHAQSCCRPTKRYITPISNTIPFHRQYTTDLYSHSTSFPVKVVYKIGYNPRGNPSHPHCQNKSCFQINIPRKAQNCHEALLGNNGLTGIFRKDLYHSITQHSAPIINAPRRPTTRTIHVLHLHHSHSAKMSKSNPNPNMWNVILPALLKKRPRPYHAHNCHPACLANPRPYSAILGTILEHKGGRGRKNRE